MTSDDEKNKLLDSLLLMPIIDRAKRCAQALCSNDTAMLEILLGHDDDAVTLLTLAAQTTSLDIYAKPEAAQQAGLLLTRTRHKNEALYATHFADGLSAKKLAEFVIPNGMTGLMLAIRIGKIDEVIDFWTKNPSERLPAENFLQQDRLGHSAVSLLAIRETLGHALTPKIWHDRINELGILLEKMPVSCKKNINPEKIIRAAIELRLQNTAKMATKFRFK